MTVIKPRTHNSASVLDLVQLTLCRAQLSEGEQTQVYRNCLSQAVSGCSFPHPIVEQLTTAVACAGRISLRSTLRQFVVLRLIRNVPAVIDDLFVLLTNPPEEVDPRLARLVYDSPIFLIRAGCWA